MEKFVLDTGIILGYVRGAGYAEYVEKKYRLFSPPNIPLISIVSKGEIYSLAVQRDWGGGKLTLLGELLRKVAGGGYQQRADYSALRRDRCV